MSNLDLDEPKDYLDILKEKQDKKSALDHCYRDISKIPEYLEEGLIDEEGAREVRRFYLFNGDKGTDYQIVLETGLRMGDINHKEYCKLTKEYYLKYDQITGDKEGVIEDFLEFDASNYETLFDFDEYYLDYEEMKPRRRREKRVIEFEHIDFRSPYGASEMPEYELNKALTLFSKIQEKYFKNNEISKPLEFIFDLDAIGFRLPKSLDKILLEVKNYDTEIKEDFKMSKLRFTRFQNKVRRYKDTFWATLFFNNPKAYKDFFGNFDLELSIN